MSDRNESIDYVSEVWFVHQKRCLGVVRLFVVRSSVFGTRRESEQVEPFKIEKVNASDV